MTQFFATKVYGFDPPTWGGLGFPDGPHLGNALETLATVPENIVFHITTVGPETQRHERGRILGITRLSDVAVPTERIVDPNAGHTIRWPMAIPFLEAWTFDEPPAELDCLPRFRRAGLSRSLGNTIVPLDAGEWPPLLSLSTTRAEIYTDDKNIERLQKNASERIARDVATVWRPPAPVFGQIVSERYDGMAFTYRARLLGNASPHACEAAPPTQVYKIGWTNNPDARESNLNFGMPDLERLRWRIDWQYPHQSHVDAERMEQEILGDLKKHVAPRGGSQEIIIAPEDAVHLAWQRAIQRRRG